MLVALWSASWGSVKGCILVEKSGISFLNSVAEELLTFFYSCEMSQWGHAIHKSKNIPIFLSSSMLAACIFCRDSVSFCIQVNLIYSSAEYH